MIETTQEMIEIYRTTGRHLAIVDVEQVRARLTGVLALIDPVPNNVRVIEDRDGVEYYRLAKGGNVWRGECGCCYFTYQELSVAPFAPITWEGKDS